MMTKTLNFFKELGTHLKPGAILLSADILRLLNIESQK